MRHLLFVLTLILVGAFADRAAAQASSDAISAVVQRADAKLEGGDYPGALADYRTAIDMMGPNLSWEVLANFSHAAFKLELLAESARALREADRRLPLTEPGHDDIKKQFADRMAEILPRIGQLRVVVDPAGAEIRIDGESYGRAPLADTIFLMPGSHQIEAQLAGYDGAAQTIMPQAGEMHEVALSLQPSRAIQPAPPPGPPSEGLSPARLGLGITGVGLGIVGLAASVVLGVTASDRNESVTELQARADAEAGGGNSCGAGSPALASNTCTQLSDFLDERDGFKSAAIGIGIAGGALLLGGIITLAVPVDDESDMSVTLSPFGSSFRGTF